MNSRARSLLLSVFTLLTGASLALLLGGCLDRKLKPLNPCLVSGVVAKISVTNIDKIDLLFMVDNSGSMKEEQEALRREFPTLVNILASGDRDGDGKNDFPPAKNLHLGVVSSDLGLVGVTGIDKCMGLGDDGVMNNVASPDVTGCSATGYPRFLTYSAGGGLTPMQIANDFSCIAALGTDGCGFEQQLEATLKAVWPADDTRVSFLPDTNGFGAMGQGDNGGMNAGFLRNDPVMGLSLIAIIFVTDEEDCSAKNTSHNRPPAYLDPNNPVDAELLKQGLNVRCNFAVNNLYTKERYINGFLALRPGNEQLVIVAGIIGVPPESVENIPEDFADNPSAQAAFYQGIRSHVRMTPMVDTLGTPSPDDDVMTPSCDTATGRAYPPNRIVDVIEGFGGNGMVQSICQDDFGPAMDQIIAIIARQLGAVCLPRPLVRDASGKVGCNVVWELPLAGKAPVGTPTACAESPFLLEVEAGEDTRTKENAARCRVAQLAALDNGMGKAAVPTDTDGIMFSDGWYYDDFSDEVQKGCTTTPKQRIAFTPNAMPPTGVTVKLECLNETQSLADNRSDLDPNVEDQPTIGDPCQEVMRNGVTLMGNSACVVQLQGDLPDDTRMFCHNDLNVCVLGCATDADCPAAWVCDTRKAVLDKTGAEHFYCVNPTCGS